MMRAVRPDIGDNLLVSSGGAWTPLLLNPVNAEEGAETSGVAFFSMVQPFLFDLFNTSCQLGPHPVIIILSRERRTEEEKQNKIVATAASTFPVFIPLIFSLYNFNPTPTSPFRFANCSR